MTIDHETRAERLQAFLARAGIDGQGAEPLAGDASTRRYFRLRSRDGGPLIVMDAPPAAESATLGSEAGAQEREAAGYNALARLAACRVDAFVAAADWLGGLGLSAPRVAAFDTAAGFAVMEDLGEDLFARRMEADAGAPPALYAAAIDVLTRIQAEAAPHRLPVRGGGDWPLLRYDALALRTGADLFLEWWPRLVEAPPFDPQAHDAWRDLWAPVLARGEAGAGVFVHRDYHAENLLWLPERSGLARVGLLDFQDAVLGHPAWDVLSLLQDVRREVGPELERAMLARFLDGRRDLDRPAFLADYAALATLNATRTAGVFARLIVRDAKPRYRAFLPRTWRLLRRNLAHPELAGLKAWFDQHVPEAARA